MATPVTKTVKPSGGDYTTLAAAETGEAGDLVTADEQLTIEIDGDWSGGADTAQVTFDSGSWTVDSTRYVRVYTTAAARHTGKWDTDKYILEVVTQWSGALCFEIDYMQIEGLQVANAWTDATTGNCIGIMNNGAAEDDISECIVRFTGSGTPNTAGDTGILQDSCGDGTHRMWNNIIYGFYHGIYYDYGGSGNTFVIYNNTVVDNINRGIWISDAIGDVSLYLKNNLCNGNSSGDYQISAFTTYVHNNNISEDATSPDTAYRSKAVTFINEGVDYRISVDDIAAKNNGADLSADAQLSFSDDINGKTRGSSWDIGADEFVATLSEKEIAESGGDYTSLAAWEAGEAGDLVHLGLKAEAKITGTWSADDSATMVIDGWYASKGNYAKIYTDGSARHHGKKTSTAHRLKPTTTTAYGFRILSGSGKGYQIEGLQVSVADIPTAVVHAIRCDQIQNLQISNCICEGPNHINAQRGISLTGSINSKVWNNICYGWDTYGIAANGSKLNIDNNTCIGASIGIGCLSVNDVIAKNNIAYGATTDYGGTFDAASSNNLSSDGTAPGSSPQINKTLQFVGFEFDDYRIIPEDTDAIDKGVDLSAEFTDDIDGHTRGATWDIGASEVVTPALRSKTIRESGGDYTSINTFFAGEEADLVHDAVYLVGQMDQAWSAADTMAVDGTGTGWVTSSVNYVKVEAIGPAKHAGGIWTATAYRLVVAGVCVDLTDCPLKHMWLKHLQIHKNTTAAFSAVQFNYNLTGSPSPAIGWVEGCIIQGGGVGATGNHAGINVEWNHGYNTIVKAWNNIIYGFGSTGYKACAIKIRKAVVFLYNNTLAKSRYGIYDDGNGSDITAKNNLSQAAGTTPIDYVNSFNASSTDNLSGDATAPGLNPEINKTVVFKNKAADNYNLVVTDPARDKGADLSADADLAFSTDLAGRTRVDPWDIGALEYSEGGGEGDDASVALVSSVMRRNARRRLMYADD